MKPTKLDRGGGATSTADTAIITQYWNTLIEFAWQGYLLQGRGLIVIWRQGLDQHIGYVDHAQVAELNDNRLVQALMPYLQHYHPHREMLCLMLGSDGAARLYRIWLGDSATAPGPPKPPLAA